MWRPSCICVSVNVCVCARGDLSICCGGSGGVRTCVRRTYSEWCTRAPCSACGNADTLTFTPRKRSARPPSGAHNFLPGPRGGLPPPKPPADRWAAVALAGGPARCAAGAAAQPGGHTAAVTQPRRHRVPAVWCVAVPSPCQLWQARWLVIMKRPTSWGCPTLFTVRFGLHS